MNIKTIAFLALCASIIACGPLDSPPGQPPDPGPSPLNPCPAVRLTEVRPGGYARADGFLEIVGDAATPAALGGWTVQANYTTATPRTIHAFPAGASLPAGGVLVLWQGPFAPPNMPPSVQDGVIQGQLYLGSRLGDPNYLWSVRLVPPSAACAPSNWVSGTTGDAYADARTGSDAAGDWKPSPEIAGLRFTPGRRADGWPFGSSEPFPGPYAGPLAFTSSALPLAARPFYPCATCPDWLYQHPLSAGGGVPPYRFALDGAQPGATVDASTGLLTFTSTAPLTGPVDLSLPVVVTDSGTPAATARQIVRARIVPEASGLTVSTREANPGRVGRLYSLGLRAIHTGGQPVAWRVAAGQLPPGLAIVASPEFPFGYVEGLPTAPGSYAATLEASAQGVTATGVLTFDVAP